MFTENGANKTLLKVNMIYQKPKREDVNFGSSFPVMPGSGSDE